MNRRGDLPSDPILRDLDGIDRMLVGTEQTARDSAERLGGSVADIAEAISSMRDTMTDMAGRIIAMEARVGHLESAAERAWVRECEEGGMR